MCGARKLAVVLIVAVLVGGLGACGSDGNSKAGAKQQRTAAAARVAAAKRAKQAAHRRLARKQMRAQSRARAAEARRLAKRARLVRLRRARAAGNPVRDRAAIQRSVRRLNAAFDAGVVRGIARSAELNYWVVAGVYDPAACIAFESDAGEGVVAETLLIRPGTFRATPGWVDPAVGRTPGGSLYAVTVDEVQTLVPTGEQRTAVHDLHASVSRKGRARLFFPCA